MSRLYFASPSGEAELHGAERHWLNHLAVSVGEAALDLTGHTDLDKIARILAAVPEVEDGQYGANYLHTQLRAALANKDAYHAAWKRHEATGVKPYQNPAVNVLDDSAERLTQSLQTRIRLGDLKFDIAGHQIDCNNINLNTALAVGSDPIKVAAKLAGWAFCLIEGPDREWLADIIGKGREAGMFRSGMGWEEIAEWLRSSDTQPVVTSHSTGDSFPTPSITGWVAPDLPSDWMPEYWDRTDWDALGDDERAEGRDEYRHGDAWYDLPHDEQWSIALAGLRERRPWCRLAPDTLGEYYFGPPVTVYHLLADDRDELVRAAFGGQDGEPDGHAAP